MEGRIWIDVSEKQQWGWFEYRVTIDCACGRIVEMWDADLSSEDDRLACECGRVYSVRLVYQEKGEKKDEALRLWERWFEEDGDPWDHTNEWGMPCFFCGEDPNHAVECVYVLAAELLGRNTE